MAPLTNGLANGHTRGLPTNPVSQDARFSDIPSAIDIPVSGMGAEEAVEVSLEELLDDPTELCTLLENENAAKTYWMVISLAYAKQRKIDHAIEILSKGLSSLSRGGPKEKLGLLSLMCWLYLWKSREAPRVAPEGQSVEEVKTKDFYLQAAVGSLNEASRIHPSFPPLNLARGVFHLLRASLHPPSKPLAPGAPDTSERTQTLRQALKCFEDASRASGARNMMAVLGRARAQFSMGKYTDALAGYQEVLMKMPHLQDPDPRIGIGCCLWHLGHREDAKEAWERSLDINSESKAANILLGLAYLHDSSQYATTDPEFGPLYKKALTQHTQKAYKLDKEYPLTCATFGNLFLARKAWPTVEALARKAIEQTDVNAIASDGWYLLARKEHHQDSPDLSKVNDFYNKADLARGGGDRGFLPARFGMTQVQVKLQDIDGAKYRLDKIIQQSKSIEAMMLLGALYAEDVFANQATGLKEDKAQEAKKAVALFEAVRLTWKDPQKKRSPDLSVLVYLARLYEADQPEKSVQCLQQVEKLSIDALPDNEPLEGEEGEEAYIARMREQLSPQLLNNIGCFQYQSERYDSAKDFFQTACNACIKAGQREDSGETDALVTTISYNLARTYEVTGLLDEAKIVYEGLLKRHADYTDARARLAYIALRQNPTEDGPKAMAALYETESANLEVRALYGWYLSRSKKRTMNLAEDQEQRHYKHTLQQFDKHDRYSLTGMGNLYLTTAREMRRDTEQEKVKRSKTYEKAVEFFDKALQLDPKNAYAAQGIAIALIEDKKDLTGAVQIFSKIRDTVREASVYVNLGHVFCDLKQYSRSIESYEAALSKDRASDPQILACLGRVWLLKGKHDKSAACLRTSLDYSHRALAIAPSQIHFKFNIAFVQYALAQLLYTLPDQQRTLSEVQAASEGLDAAIESLSEIAQSKNPPYPKNDIEQRASMGRNTMRKQLERAIQSQREYEEANAHKLQQARETREAELRKREEARQLAEAAAAEEKRKIAEERHKMLTLSRELAEKRAEEERRKEEAEYTTDTETGERYKRKKTKKGGKRKKKGEESESDGDPDRAAGRSRKKNRGKSTEDNTDIGTDGEQRAPKRRRKLTKKGGGREGKGDSKFKSTELVVESDSDDNAAVSGAPTNGHVSEDPDTPMEDAPPSGLDSEDDDADLQAAPRKKPTRRIAEDDEDEDEHVIPPTNVNDPNALEATVPDLDGELDAAHEAAKGNAFADGPDAPKGIVDDTVGAAGDPDTNEQLPTAIY